MIREFFAFFFTGYLYSSVFLLPFYSFYFVIDPVRFSPSLMLRFHKWVVVSTIITPLFFTILMFPPGSNKADNFDGQLRSDSYMHVEIKNQVKNQVKKPIKSDYPLKQSGYINTLQSYHQIALGGFYYLIDIITGLIMIGFIIFVIRFSIQQLYLNYIERGSIKKYYYDKHPIIISSQITLPFSAGFRLQKIYLPDGLVPDDSKIILNHELNHFQKNHHYWSILESLIIHIFWFNPVSHLIRKRGILFREMECDTDTIQTIDKYIYSRVLLKTAESMQPSGRLGLMVQQWMQKGVLKKRLENILNGKKAKHRRLISFGFFLVLFFSIGAFVFISLLNDDTLENNLIKKTEIEYASILQTRESIAIKEVPNHLKEILIFNEDTGFYNHEGVSVKALLRALLNNLSGGPLQGGSTISQQLSRILCIQIQERTLSRKFKQVKAAQVLEKHFTKDQILEMYLNSVYLGQGTFGVEMASKKFFNHPASELTIAESAMLIQSLAKPKFNNYLANPRIAKSRTGKLVYRMVDCKLLDKKTAEQSMVKLKIKLGTST